VTVRLPIELSQRLDDRARLEDKTATDVVTEALEDLLSAPSVTIEDSEVMRAARQIRELENEIDRLEREEAYVDAKENLEIIGLPSIAWFDDKATIRLARHAGTNRVLVIGREGYDQRVKDRPVNETIVGDYEGRIGRLKDKVAALKAEIVGTNVLQ
jgi:predicted DNA-binding protein